MRRWAAVALGCVTGLGMQALFTTLLNGGPLVGYAVLFVALLLAGYVAGHLTGQFQALYGAMAAVLFIFVTATVNAAREVAVAREFGLAALGPIDFVQLALTDLVAMTAASCGGWLASRFA